MPNSLHTFPLWHLAGILKPQDKPIPLADSLSRWYQEIPKTFLTPTSLERQHSVRHLIRLLSLLEQLPLHHPRQKRSCRPEWVNHAVDILASSDLSQPCPIETVASACGVGIHTFRRSFARAMGMGPAAYHHKLKLEAASRMLKTESIPAKEVSEKFGFCNPSYFSFCFKKRIGFNPRDFSRRFGGRARTLKKGIEN